MEEYLLLAQAVVGKKEVKLTHDDVGPFPTTSCLITQEVHLVGESFAIHSEYATLPWSEEVYWTRLHGIRRVVYLLGVVEGVVNSYIDFIGRTL